MIGLIKLALKTTQKSSGSAPTITAGFDSFERPLPTPGLSGAEQALNRSGSLTRRNSFDGDVVYLAGAAIPSAHSQAQRAPAMMFGPRPIAAMPPPSLAAQAATQQRRGPQPPPMQPAVPRFVDRRSRLSEITQFVVEIDQLESRLRGQMGWLAIDGVRNLTSVSMGVASVIGLVFSILALTVHHLLPGLGIIVFASIVVGGIVLGVLAQTLARWLWARRNDTAPLRAELNDIRERIMRQAPDGRIESLFETEIRQLRRLERLEVRLDGGFFNTLGDALIGTFGWDPRLGDMLGRAAKSRNEAAKRAAARDQALAARQAAIQAGPAMSARPNPARNARIVAQPVRRPAGPPRSASDPSRAQEGARRVPAANSQRVARQQSQMPAEPARNPRGLRWAANVVRVVEHRPVRQR